MDFGGFILVGLLGMAFAFFALTAIVIRLVYRKTSKLILTCAGGFLLLFLSSGGWIFYVYGLNEPLAIAAGEGDVSRVRFLLKLGASPNAEGVDNMNNALTAAAEAGHTEIVSSLLKKGADPLRKDGEGQTALECAKRNKHADIVQLLEEAQRNAHR